MMVLNVIFMMLVWIVAFLIFYFEDHGGFGI